VTWQLIATRHFERRLRRFERARPDLRRSVAQALLDLEQDPFQPRLRLHALSGQLEGPRAVSVTRAYRVVLTLRVSDRGITLLDIGSHDDVYR
jgi:mRNA-degrading endonuclease YafQ of YafQ-DinJ toxin-antitoxin module